MSTYTETSPTTKGALPAGITSVGGIVFDLVGLNGARVTAQLSAGSLFSGFASSAIFTIGTQTGFTPALIAALGGGLAEVAVRVTLYDGDSSPGNFDDSQNWLLIDGINLGSFTRPTEITTAAGVSVSSSTGFGDSVLATGWWYITTPATLASIYAALGDGSINFQLQDADYGENLYDFTQGVSGGLVNVGAPPNISPIVSGPVTSTATEDDSGYSVDLLGGASDGDGDPLDVEDLSHDSGDDSGITPSVDGNSLIVDPNAYNHLAAGESEVINYSYNIEDGNGGTVAQTATITINGVNDGPTANDDALGGNGAGGKVLIVGGFWDDATAQAYLAAQGMTSNIVAGSDLETTDLTGYTAIWVSWGTSVTDTGGTLAAKLAAFIAAGGNVLVEADTNMLPYLPSGGDITAHWNTGEDVVIVDTSGQLDDGLTSADLSTWLNSYHNSFTLSDYDQFKVMAENGAGDDITLVQNFGLGSVVVTGQDVSYHLIFGDWNGAGSGATSPQLEFLVNALALGDPLTDEDTAVVIEGTDLLANDSDPDTSDTLEISAVDSFSTLGAAVSLNLDGTIDYDPTGALNYLAAGEEIEDSFSYTIEDGNGGSDTATVTFKVLGVNDGPTANNDSLSGGGGAGHVLLLGWEIDSTIQAYLAARGWTSDLISPEDLETTDLSGYDAIWAGSGSYVTDVGGTLAAKLAAFVAAGGNMLVEAGTNLYAFLPNGGDLSDTWDGGDDVSIVDTSGELDDGLTSAGLSNWFNSYHSGLAVTDDDQFKVVVENGAGTDLALVQRYGGGNIVVTSLHLGYHLLYGSWNSGSATTSAQIEFILNALELSNPLTDEDTAVVIDGADLLANDTDPDTSDTLAISGVTALSLLGASVSLSGGMINYDPTGALDYLDEGEVVEDSFTYTISDGNGGSDSATVTFKVVGVNDGPTNPIDEVAPDGASISEHHSVGTAIGLDADSTDADGDTLSYFFRDGSNNAVQTLGKFTIDAATGVVTLSSAVNYELQTSYTLRIYASDGMAESYSDFTVTIENVVEHLFTPGNDGTAGAPINFNLLPDGAYDFDDAYYDALAGNDYVYLPNEATVDAGNPWDYSKTFSASAGDDVVQGGDGDDIISGGDGNDRLFGATGDDRLVGSSGNDILAGGDGTDKLTGASGRDIFIFTDTELGTTKLGEHDTITDFQQGTDRIDISALYDGGAYGGLRNGSLRAGIDANKVGYYSASGKTWIEGDVTGDGVADFVIELSGSYKLKGTDLVVGPSFIESQGQWNTATGGLNWVKHHQEDYFL